jgi:ergothioneine biosynthesis protein EgtB
MPVAREHPADTEVRQAAVSGLLKRFRTTRQATTSFCAPLSPEDMMVQSCTEASPVKWHLAHTSWFFETFVLRDFLPGYKPFHPDFHWLFNSYYNSLGDMPEKRLRSSFSRPPLSDILAYRTHVDAAIATLLETPSNLPDEARQRIALGLHHEQQHLELIATDIKHAFYTNPLHPPLHDGIWKPGSSIAPPVTWVNFSPGLIDIGATPDPAADPTDPAAFAFDNETPQHKVYLAPFSLASRLVTCAEYLAFIDDNAYNRPELWLSEGWTTLREHRWEAPLYWRRDSSTQSGWSIYTLHGFLPLDDLSETPVCHLSFFEADAFARWSNARLPTEFEWEYAATSSSPVIPSAARNPSISPEAPPQLTANLLESQNLHPTPAPAPSNPGLQQLFGDVWEWTSSPYTGYSGYRPLPGALGEYNGKFMSSQIILRGGSCVTPATHIRATYRNFFSPSTRWQFSGLRLAKDVAASGDTQAS